LYSPNVAIYQKLGYVLKKTGVIDVDGTRFEVFSHRGVANSSFIVC